MGRRKKVVNNNDEFDNGQFIVRPKTPFQLRRDVIDYPTRVAITLYTLCGWSQVEAYLTAFPNSRLSPQSAPVVANRWFNDRWIKVYCELYANYYGGTCFHIKKPKL